MYRPVYSWKIKIASNSKFTSMETVTNIRDMITEQVKRDGTITTRCLYTQLETYSISYQINLHQIDSTLLLIIDHS